MASATDASACWWGMAHRSCKLRDRHRPPPIDRSIDGSRYRGRAERSPHWVVLMDRYLLFDAPSKNALHSGTRSRADLSRRSDPGPDFLFLDLDPRSNSIPGPFLPTRFLSGCSCSRRESSGTSAGTEVVVDNRIPDRSSKLSI